MVATLIDITEKAATTDGFPSEDSIELDSQANPPQSGVELDPTGQTMLETGGYLTLREAALAVDKSEQTIRRLVKAKKVLSRKVRTRTGFVYLVEPVSLRQACAAGQPDIEPPAAPSVEEPAPAAPAPVPAWNEFFQAELERLREELARERARNDERTEELIAARTQAGRWEGMAQGFERYNQQLFQRLALMEENHRPTEPEVVWRSAERRPVAKTGGWVVWLVGVLAALLVSTQLLALWHRGL